MERQVKETIKNLEKRAFNNLRFIAGEEKLSCFLRIWWSFYYKRPSKDPLLESYTLEELALEFFEQSLYNNEEAQEEIKKEWLFTQKEEEILSDEEWADSQEKEMLKQIKSGELEFHDKF